MQEKSQNLSGKKEEESMIHEKMSCIDGSMVKSNLVISLVPYAEHRMIIKRILAFCLRKVDVTWMYVTIKMDYVYHVLTTSTTISFV